MKKTEKKAGILGIGNLLLSDESFGIHVVKYLDSHYTFPDSVTLMDGGTAGIYMAPFLEDHDPIFVVDVVNLKDAVPGNLYSFSAEDAKDSSMQTRMSPHQLGILEMLDICKFRGVEPDTVEFLCVIPQSVEMGLELSDPVAPQVANISEKLVERLQTLGYAISKKEAKHA
ncbi:MAG: hydrogenase maturation endopeptidase [Desulfocapsa sp.]|nr:MAG: hydrogenase maturation endopeptidase [Desulfocapsa sp.]